MQLHIRVNKTFKRINFTWTIPGQFLKATNVFSINPLHSLPICREEKNPFSSFITVMNCIFSNIATIFVCSELFILPLKFIFEVVRFYLTIINHKEYKWQ